VRTLGQPLPETVFLVAHLTVITVEVAPGGSEEGCGMAARPRPGSRTRLALPRQGFRHAMMRVAYCRADRRWNRFSRS